MLRQSFQHVLHTGTYYPRLFFVGTRHFEEIETLNKTSRDYPFFTNYLFEGIQRQVRSFQIPLNEMPFPIELLPTNKYSCFWYNFLTLVNNMTPFQ